MSLLTPAPHYQPAPPRRIPLLRLLLGVWLLSLLVACTDSADQNPPFTYEKTLSLKAGISDLAWHPNGKWIAVNSYLSQTVTVWDVEKDELITRLAKNGGVGGRWGDEIAFSKDGSLLIALDTHIDGHQNDPIDLLIDRQVARAWKVADWAVAFDLSLSKVRPGNMPQALCVSHDGKIATIASPYEVANFDLSTGQLLSQTSLEHPFEDKSIEFAPGSMDCNPKRPQVVFGGHWPPRREGEKRASVEEEMATPMVPILVFDQDTLTLQHHFLAHTTQIKLRFSGDGRWLFSEPRRSVRGVFKKTTPDDPNAQHGYLKKNFSSPEPAFVWNTRTWEKHIDIRQAPQKRRDIVTFAASVSADRIPNSQWMGILDTEHQSSLKFWHLQDATHTLSVQLPDQNLIRIASTYPFFVTAKPDIRLFRLSDDFIRNADAHSKE